MDVSKGKADAAILNVSDRRLLNLNSCVKNYLLSC